MKPRRNLWPFYIVGFALVLFLVWSVRWYVRDQASKSANTAAAIAAKVERKANAHAADIGYQNALNACKRGLSVRQATRDNALANQKVYRVLGSFLQGARPRALAQSQDPNISAKSRAAALASLTSIDKGIGLLSVQLKIPPKPPKCTDVIHDPNAPVIVAPQNP